MRREEESRPGVLLKVHPKDSSEEGQWKEHRGDEIKIFLLR
jgi:hypothetical protein